MPESPPIFQLEHVSKSFIHSRALNNLDLSILEGETLGIVGHNGAGKSTLVNILIGALRASSGRVRLDGVPLRPDYDVHAANSLGIRAVFQELSLCPNLTVVENMKVFHPGLRGIGWQKKAGAMIGSTMDRIFPGNSIRAGDPVESLSLGQRQVVEIAKAFCAAERTLKLVVLDEPTSALDHHATGQLIEYINSLRGGALSVIYISHLLDEVLACTSRIAVLKDGSNVGVVETPKASRAMLIELMGEARLIRDGATNGSRERRNQSIDPAPFVVQPVAATGRPVPPPGQPVAATGQPAQETSQPRFHVRAGEIVGLAGLAGHGQTELLHALFDHKRNGAYRVTGPVTFIPGDRQSEGIFPVWSIAKNISLQVYGRLKRFLLIDRGRENAVADKWKSSIGIKTDSVTRGILSLSGGNQQKVLFARCLESSSPLVLMDDPTRGVDVGTKDEIYRLIMEESAGGRSFIWYTTEMDELKYCDRIYVFRSGAIIAELAGDEATEEDILKSSF